MLGYIVYRTVPYHKGLGCKPYHAHILVCCVVTLYRMLAELRQDDVRQHLPYHNVTPFHLTISRCHISACRPIIYFVASVLFGSVLHCVVQCCIVSRRGV